MEGGVYDYGNPRAWGDNAVWKFGRQEGVKIGKPSVVWYGYFPGIAHWINLTI